MEWAVLLPSRSYLRSLRQPFGGGIAIDIPDSCFISPLAISLYLKAFIATLISSFYITSFAPTIIISIYINTYFPANIRG